MIQHPRATSRRWISDQSDSGAGRRPDCQKSVSNSTTGRPSFRESARARADFPAAPRPRMTTRCVLTSGASQRIDSHGSAAG